MNDKNRQRHIAYEVLVILGQLALLTYITRLWPILLLIILGIFVAALRLLFLSSQKVEPVRPLLTLPPPHQPPTEKDLQSAAYTIVQCRITQILSAKFPEARWVWENPRAMEDILAGNPTYVLLNRAGGYRRGRVVFRWSTSYLTRNSRPLRPPHRFLPLIRIQQEIQHRPHSYPRMTRSQCLKTLARLHLTGSNPMSLI